MTRSKCYIAPVPHVVHPTSVPRSTGAIENFSKHKSLSTSSDHKFKKEIAKPLKRETEVDFFPFLENTFTHQIKKIPAQD